MTNQPREARIPLEFLPEGAAYKAWIYRDGSVATELVIKEMNVTQDDILDISMLQRGGFAIHLKPVQ